MGMNICDSRSSGSIVTTKPLGNTVIMGSKDSIVCQGSTDNTVVAIPDQTEIISLDGQYLRGPKGDVGDTPSHEWSDTSLRFRNPDGTWGVATDLEGPQGPKGDQGIQGLQGNIGIGVPGPTSYVWAKYADTNTPAPIDMVDNPEGKIWVGLAYNREIPEGGGDPLEFDYLIYNWSKIQGSDGNDGIDGDKGDQGEQGPGGEGFTWLGEFDEHPTEADIGRELQNGDTYLNLTDQRVYTYAGGWHLMLDSGATGPSGPQGAPGGGFVYQGELYDAPAGAQVNWLYKNLNDELFYAYGSSAAWEVATSDGKASTEGADSSDGWYFYTTYSGNDIATTPTRPTTDGNSGEWLASPYDHEVGTINWCSQKIVQSSDPNQGVWGDPFDISNTNFRGPEGFRGSQSIMVPIVNWSGIWSDRDAEQAVGGAPQEWDVVTMYKSSDPEIQETKRWGYNTQTGTYEWLAYNYVFLGDVLVDGSLDAQKINVNSTMTVGTGDNVGIVSGEDTIRFAAGNANKALAPFQVDQSGKLTATDVNITGTVNATDGVFSGTVYANRIEGDLDSAKVYTAAIETAVIPTGSSGQTSIFDTIYISTPRPYDRTLSVGVLVSITLVGTTTGSYVFGSVRSYASSTWGTFQSDDYASVTQVSPSSEVVAIKNIQTVISIPANETGYITLQASGGSISNESVIGMRGVSGSKYLTTLSKNGTDLR